MSCSKRKYKHDTCVCGNIKLECAKQCRLCANKAHAIKMTGNGNSMYHSCRSGKLNPFYNKKHTKSAREKMSKHKDSSVFFKKVLDELFVEYLFYLLS